MNISFAQVQVNDTIQNDFADGTVLAVTDDSVTVQWENGVDSYTWEEVREYGFTFRR